MMVFCDDDTCRFNYDGIACRAPNITIKVGTGTREDLTVGAVNVCSDYRSKDNGETDI